MNNSDTRYGATVGQIGSLREGDFASAVGAISSPPYVSGGHHPDQIGSWGGQAQSVDRDMAGYGKTDGQIGQLHEGDFAQVVGAVTSPPYEASINSSSNGIDWTKEKLDYPGCQVHSDRVAMHNRIANSMNYGATAGQIGAESGETYWQAMRQVYTELYQVLKPNGAAAIVVKDFVRNKQIVPLCDMTARLLEVIGFTIIERTHAMLVKEQHTGIDMFSGEHVTKRTERKSFFRRLAEKNGSPRIDWEEILWAQKPA